MKLRLGSQSLFFPVWVILMEIVWDRQCPRATSPSPPFLGKGFWSEWVWNAAVDSRPPGPVLNQSWFGPEPQQWCIPRVAEGQSFSSVCSSVPHSWSRLNVWPFKSTVISFQTAVPWRFQRPWHPWKADSFNCSLLQRRSLHSVRCFFFPSYKQQCIAAFLAVGVALKALPACPSVCCLSLFRLRASLSSLFTISVQKCHSPLSWAFTHTYTKHAHKWQPLKPPIKGQWQWEFCLCYKLELLQMLWQVCFPKMYCLWELNEVQFSTEGNADGNVMFSDRARWVFHEIKRKINFTTLYREHDN